MFFKTIAKLLLISATISCIGINPKGPVYQNYSTSCVMDIVQQQFNSTNNFLTILVTSNMTPSAFGIQNKIIKEVNNLLRWSIEILSGKRVEFESGEICLNCPVKKRQKKILKQLFQPKYKTDFCLMVVDSIDNFITGLQNYLKSAILYIRAYFLVYMSAVSEDYEQLAEEILNILWEYKISNAAVVIAKNSLKILNIYGLDVYAPSETCGESPRLLLMDTCRKGKVVKNWQLFGNKVPKTLHNCSIQTLAMKYPPFIINENSGFEVKVLKQFGKILNVSFNLIVEENVINWGTRLSKNNWTGPLQEALNISAIAIGNVMVDPDLAEDFTLTVGYFYEHMVWVVPAALPITPWKNIFVIFEYQLWMLCIGYFIVTALLFQVTAGPKELPRFKRLGTNFLTSLRVLVGIASPEQPKTMLVRTVFMSLAVYSMILLVQYQTLLITFLTNTVYEKQISNLHEILDAKLEIGGLESYKDFFNVTTDKTAMRIYNMFKTYNMTNDTAYNWISKVANNRDTCTISSSFYVKFLLAESDPAVTIHRKPKIFVLKKILFTYPIRMVLPKGFPLAERFNQIIEHLLNGGIVEQWARSYYQHMKKKEERDYSENDKEKQLTLGHLQGAFNLLFFGYAFGLASLLLEMIFVKIEKTEKYKQLKGYFKSFQKKFKPKKK